MNKLKESIINWIDKNDHQFKNTAKILWENPELSMQEYQASSMLANLLEDNGFQVEKGVAGLPTAFVATFGQGKPVIAFSSEYDALPGLSQKAENDLREPVEQGAPGHGCGHNLLGVTGILAASALKQHIAKEGVSGTIKVFGTPAEELCIGKPFMARKGIFKDVDAFLDWHPSDMNRVAACSNNAYFNMKYHFKGQSAHGNSPWFGRSTLDAGMLMGHAIEMLREHIKPGIESAANTINYAFPDVGNSFPNVVPDHTAIWCVGRFANTEQCRDVIARIDQCAEGAAIATGTTVEREFITATHDMIPNASLARVMDENLKWIGAPHYSEEEQSRVVEIQKTMGIQPTGFSEEILPIATGSIPVTDSAEYSWFAPLTMLNLALTPSTEMGWHNWIVTKYAGSDVGMKLIDKAAKILAATGYDLFMNPAIITEAQTELRDRLNGKIYRSLLPDDIEPNILMNRELMDKYRK